MIGIKVSEYDYYEYIHTRNISGKIIQMKITMGKIKSKESHKIVSKSSMFIIVIYFLCFCYIPKTYHKFKLFYQIERVF